MWWSAALVLIILVLIYDYVTSIIVLKKSNLPHPFLLPVIGHLYKFFGNPEEFTKKVFLFGQTFKKSAALYLGPQYVVAIHNPDDIGSIPNYAAKKKSKHYEFMRMALGDGILTNFGERHKQSKKVLLEAMHINNLKKYEDDFNSQSQDMVDDLVRKIGEKESNIQDLIGFHIFKTVLRSVVGLPPNIIEDEDIVGYNHQMEKYTDCAFTRAYSIWLYPDFLFKFTSLYRTQRKISDSMHALTEYFINERKRKFENLSEIERQNDKVFIDTFFTAKKDNGEDFTMEEMRDDAMTLFCGGVETTQFAVGTLIMLLAIHVDVQEKVYDEIMEKIGDKNDITIDDVNELTYMEQVYNETLRIFSPLPMVGREVLEDFTLPNNKYVRKGSNLLVLLLLLHRNPDIYPNPTEFNPDNFSAENVEKRSPHAFIPYGIGSRKCIGAAYGRINIKILMVHLLKNFIFRTSLTMENFRICAQITTKNKTGTIVSVHRRENRTDNYSK